MLRARAIRISYNMARRYVAGLFRPTGGINRNIPTRHVIIANYDVKFPVTVVTVTSALSI